MKEACGVFGVYAPGKAVAQLTFDGMFALQHRGQESAGMAVSDGETITVVRDMGLVTTVFDERTISCLPGALAIGHTQTTQLFGEGSARPADNHTIIIEFRVDDVDSEYERLKPLVSDWVQEPTTMPWGNRSILFRDPDGNLVNFFTPVTPEAKEKFGR